MVMIQIRYTDEICKIIKQLKVSVLSVCFFFALQPALAMISDVGVVNILLLP